MCTYNTNFPNQDSIGCRGVAIADDSGWYRSRDTRYPGLGLSGADGDGHGLWGAAARCGVGLVFVLLCLLGLPLDRALDLRDHTLGPHTHTEALLKTALLALTPHVHVNLAVVAVFALVHRVLCDAAPEEPCKHTHYCQVGPGHV